MYKRQALELTEGLLGPDGQPDPMRPEWASFCKAKTEDLLDRVPDLAGLIVNLSSPESRVSMPDHVETQQDDREKGPWFDGMIAAFQSPLNRQGKALYVRDFAYTTDVQSDVLAAIARCDGTVQASVKVTAHDYFPRAAENPAVQQAGPDAVLEVDAFGEHTGWGVVPNCRVVEFATRLSAAREGSNHGLLVRTSWEAIVGANALDSLSAVNVYALPLLLKGETDATAAVKAWLDEAHGVIGETAETAIQLLLRSWDIPAATYWDDFVFPRHSCLPSTWQEGWMSMETIGMGRRERGLSISSTDERLSEKTRLRIFAEKENATALAGELAQAAAALEADLPDTLARLFASFAWMPLFAKQFELAIKATFYAARALPEDLQNVRNLHAALIDFAGDLEDTLKAHQDLPHHHRVLLDPDQIRRFAASLLVV